MGMQWVRLDANFHLNHKIMILIEDRRWRALFVWLASLAHAGSQGTDGFIPAGALGVIHGTRSDARTLVDVGLWHTVLGGWQINDWDEYQPSTEEMHQRRKNAQRAAMLRWHDSED